MTSLTFFFSQTVAHSNSSQLGLHIGRFLSVPDPIVCERATAAFG